MTQINTPGNVSGESKVTSLTVREIVFTWCLLTLLLGWISGAIVGAGELIVQFIVLYVVPFGALGCLGHLCVRWFNQKSKK